LGYGVDKWPGIQETLAATGGKVLIERPFGVSLGMGYTGSANILPGMLVTGIGETSPDLDLPDARSDEIAGVAMRMCGTAAVTAPDTAFADNEPFEFAPTGSGCVVVVKFLSGLAWVPGQYVISQGTGLGEGTFTALVAAGNITSFISHFKAMFGRSVTFKTTTATGTGGYTYCLVRLSL
jgi:hypothetical protein